MPRLVAKTRLGRQAAPFALVAATFGVIVVVIVFAAGTPIALEPEAGTLANGAVVASVSGQSGSGAIKFAAGATPTPTPTSTPGGRSCPAYPSFPDANCTGVPAGTALTVVSGNQTYGTSSNGLTITGKDFRGYVTVIGSNITFTNCIFRGGTNNPSAGLNQLLNGENATNMTVIDSEFVPTNPSPNVDGVWASNNATLIRVHIHGGVDGMKTFGPVLLQDSYIHDMNWFASDPSQGGGETHNDGIQAWPTNGFNVTVAHSKIDMSTTNNGNSAVQSSSQNRIQNSYLDGGGCTLNFAAQPLGGAILTPIYVNNNRFGRHQGFAGCVVLISNKTVLTEYIGNVWADTLTAVPAPQQHD